MPCLHVHTEWAAPARESSERQPSYSGAGGRCETSRLQREGVSDSLDNASRFKGVDKSFYFNGIC